MEMEELRLSLKLPVVSASGKDFFLICDSKCDSSLGSPWMVFITGMFGTGSMAT